MNKSKTVDKTFRISLTCLIVGLIFTSLAQDSAVEATEVPISPYYPSHEKWGLYQFEGKGYQQKYTTSDGKEHPAFSNTNCGPASSAMVINYLKNRGLTTTYGSFTSESVPDVHCTARGNYCQRIRDPEHPEGNYWYANSDWSYPGATSEQIQHALSLEGIKSHMIKGEDYGNAEAYLRDLKEAIDQGRVSIACVNPQEYVGEYNRTTTVTSHWVIVYGYDDDHIYLNDPGWRAGKGAHITKSHFVNALWNVEPSSWRITIIIDTTVGPPSGRVTVDLDTKYWEDGLYQLRITAQASPGDVSSITISGPHIDTATVQTGGGDPHYLYDDGKHHDGAANDGEWWVLLNIKESPVIGETITFHIKYNDGSSEIISKTIDGLVTETATLVSPHDGSTVDTLTPTFQWHNPSISGLIYSVQIDDPSHNRVYSVYDLPDGTTSHTIHKPLTRGATYLWLVSASDSNGNEALTCWDKLRISSLTGLGYDEVTQVTDTINQGTEAVFNYIISQTKDLIFALGWEGSTLKLSVYRPDGSLYAEGESNTSPITISIPKAEAGEWRYRITGIDIPYDDYPFVAEIGERRPVASDLENLVVYPNPCRLTDSNPTITFKGLTTDATIRILSIDGQLIYETELIGQVRDRKSVV